MKRKILVGCIRNDEFNNFGKYKSCLWSQLTLRPVEVIKDWKAIGLTKSDYSIFKITIEQIKGGTK